MAGLAVASFTAPSRRSPLESPLSHVTQRDCSRIAKTLNTRPRKRYDYDTPEERFHAA